jgi:hypothetical protein
LKKNEDEYMEIEVSEIEKFRTLLKKAILLREQSLNPENPLFTLPLDLHQEDEVRREQMLLSAVLSQFERIFGGKNV